MRYESGNQKHPETFLDKDGKETREITKKLLKKFPDKNWVIDAGSLQVMDASWIPENAILTPNKKEYRLLFGKIKLKEAARKYKCIILLKGPIDLICSAKKCEKIDKGNPGLTKGGTGDVLAGLTVALLAKNEPFLAASAASYITKQTADELYKKVGTNYNAEDLADKIPEVYHSLTK
jgi:NAD(P)H-hydrate epimerase